MELPLAFAPSGLANFHTSLPVAVIVLSTATAANGRVCVCSCFLGSNTDAILLLINTLGNLTLVGMCVHTLGVTFLGTLRYC